MEIRYSKRFLKQYKKLSKEIREKFKERLIIFLKNYNDAKLHVHKLSGKLNGLWSLNITGDIRVIFDKSFDNVILFEEIGTHSELYS